MGDFIRGSLITSKMNFIIKRQGLIGRNGSLDHGCEGYTLSLEASSLFVHWVTEDEGSLPHSHLSITP